MEKVKLSHPRQGTVEVDATPAAMTPYMAQGYVQVRQESASQSVAAPVHSEIPADPAVANEKGE